MAYWHNRVKNILCRTSGIVNVRDHQCSRAVRQFSIKVVDEFKSVFRSLVL